MNVTRQELSNKQWEENYKLAQKYYLQYGNLLVPHSFIMEGRRLGRWIGTQRGDYFRRTNAFFTQDRIERLEKIGMVWEVSENSWESMYRALQSYFVQHKTTRVPQSYVTSDGKKLGVWVNRQRLDYKAGKLNQERKQRLQSLDMVWDAEILRRGQWDKNYRLLKDYLAEYGGRFPPYNFITEKGEKLGAWLCTNDSFTAVES